MKSISSQQASFSISDIDAVYDDCELYLAMSSAPANGDEQASESSSGRNVMVDDGRFRFHRRIFSAASGWDIVFHQLSRLLEVLGHLKVPFLRNRRHGLENSRFHAAL